MTETAGICYAQGLRDGALAGLKIVRAMLEASPTAIQMMPKRKATERPMTSDAMRRFEEAVKRTYAP